MVFFLNGTSETGTTESFTVASNFKFNYKLEDTGIISINNSKAACLLYKPSFVIQWCKVKKKSDQSIKWIIIQKHKCA